MPERQKSSSWIAILGGFLCDPRAGEGEVQIRDDVAYWHPSLGGEYVLDLTDEGLAEAKRRNEMDSHA